MHRTYTIKFPEDYNNIIFHERDSLRFICKRCHNEVLLKHINLKKLKDYRLMLCRGCLQKYTKKKLYGDENYNNRDKFVITAHNWSEEQKKKRLQTRINTDLKKHGVEYFNNSVKTSKTKKTWSSDRKVQTVNKIKDTKRLRYGDPNYNNSKQIIESKKNWTKEQKETIIDRIRNTKLQKYGNPYYSNRELAVETLRNKFPEEKKTILNKRKCSLKEIYDDENYNNRQQYKNTMINLLVNGLIHINHLKNDLYESKHICAINNNVKILYSSECKKYVDYCNTKYPNWDNIYRKDNPYNPSYWCYITKGKGISPYDIDNNSEYSIAGKSVGPYDIIK